MPTYMRDIYLYRFFNLFALETAVKDRSSSIVDVQYNEQNPEELMEILINCPTLRWF